MVGFIIGLILGLIIGAGGVIVAIVKVYVNNKKKISQALVIIADNSLSSDQKVTKIKELFSVFI